MGITSYLPPSIKNAYQMVIGVRCPSLLLWIPGCEMILDYKNKQGLVRFTSVITALVEYRKVHQGFKEILGFRKNRDKPELQRPYLPKAPPPKCRSKEMIGHIPRRNPNIIILLKEHIKN